MSELHNMGESASSSKRERGERKRKERKKYFYVQVIYTLYMIFIINVFFLFYFILFYRFPSTTTAYMELTASVTALLLAFHSSLILAHGILEKILFGSLTPSASINDWIFA